MNIAAINMSPNLDSLMTDIARYDVTQHALELQMYGFTVVPPEKLGVDEAWTARLRDAVIRTYQKRYDVEIGDYTESDLEPVNFGKTWRLIEEDDVFVEATLNPVSLTLIRSLLGQSAVLGNDTWLMRAKDNEPRGMHTDATGVPLGAGQIALMVNASWLCTDYLEEGDGPTVMVPGSFRFVTMLLQGGELDGARIVSPKTLRQMRTNHLPGGADLTEMSRGLVLESNSAGTGFGLGFSMVIDPAKTLIPASLGEYYWGGAYSTAFFVDPVEAITCVFMSQVYPSSAYPTRRQLKTLIYAALSESRA